MLLYYSLLSLVPQAAAQIACIAAFTTTRAYLPALSSSTGGCPNDSRQSVSYNLLDTGSSSVCCTQAAQIKSADNGQVACCPCGALCTGTLPSVLDWTLAATGLATSAGTTGTSRPVPSAIATTTVSSINSEPAATITSPATAQSSSPSSAPTSSQTSNAVKVRPWLTLVAGVVAGFVMAWNR